MVDPVDPRSLLSFARIKPLAAWSLSAVLLGSSLALFQSQGGPLDIAAILVASASVVLIQYVAHPMNDLMDVELDREAPIAPTGRVKPIVDGSTTPDEARWLTIVVIGAIIALLAWLVYRYPLALFPASYGLAGLFGYNHSAFRLAYHPFTELYLSMPVNALAVLLVAYVGSGTLSLASAILAVVFGFAASSFFVSMMSMDFDADRAHGKMTTIASHPRLRWCTLYPAFGLVVLGAGSFVILEEFGAALGSTILIISASTLVVLTLIGGRVDRERLRSSGGEDNVAFAGRCRLQQLYLSIAFAVTLSTVLFIASAP